METTKKSSALLIGFLVLVVAGLVALDMYQDKVIAQQRYELNWLMTHATIKGELPAPMKGAPAAQAPAALNSDQKPAAGAVPATTQSAAAVAPNASTAKP